MFIVPAGDWRVEYALLTRQEDKSKETIVVFEFLTEIQDIEDY